MSQPQMSDLDMTRFGLMQILVSAMAYPPGTYDDRSIVELVRGALKLHAYCVREEVCNGLLQASKLDAALIKGVRAAVQKQRVEQTILLQEYATFMATASEVFKTSAVSH